MGFKTAIVPLNQTRKPYKCIAGKAIMPKTEPAGRANTAGYSDTLWQIALTCLGKGARCTGIVKLNGRGSSVL